MNAMFDRLNSISPGKVGLLHSRSLLAMFRRLMEQEYTPEDAVRKARWLRNLSKLRYQPIQIFSPYQMLKAAYQLKGYEAMLVDFAGSAFIFDEIHAYEPERLALILELLIFLREKLKASFFVMSATLPSVIQNRLKDTLGSAVLIQASKEVFQRFTRHQVNLLKGELLSEEGLVKIKGFYEQGKSVLVTCNTVSRAQEVYNRLAINVTGESLILAHSRFNGLDRLEKEQRIIEITGLKSKIRRPVIVVSTQVVEVSLNIDLDVLFSDPAPLEALLQRFGRVNRGGRVVIAPVYVFTEPDNGQGVYSTDLVRGAIKVLYSYADGNLLNESAVQGWLDEIYTGVVLEDWE
jgi:CRISPR-associated endonuclease/helicase Cas3